MLIETPGICQNLHAEPIVGPMRHPQQFIAPVIAISGVLVFLEACSGGQNESLSPPNFSGQREDASTAAPPVENVQAPITHLERKDVVEVVDLGMGRFLQKFSVEESLNEQGAFQGFRIVHVEERRYFEGLGIGLGDVITKINDQPIERPAQAYAAFVGLKTAPRLDIDYLRGGRPMRLSLPIVGEPPVAPDKVELPPQSGKAEPARSPGEGGKIQIPSRANEELTSGSQARASASSR